MYVDDDVRVVQRQKDATTGYDAVCRCSDAGYALLNAPDRTGRGRTQPPAIRVSNILYSGLK